MPLLTVAEIEPLRATLRAFANREVRPRVEEMERAGHVPDELLARLAEIGVFGAPLPTAWGGAGLGELAFAVVQEELARAHASTALLVAASSGLAARSIALFGSDAQRERYLRPLASGEDVGAFCLTEARGGSDVPGIEARAKATPGGFALRGEKAFVTNGDRAGVLLVFAKTAPAAGRDGISLFAVERSTPGIELVRLEDKLGLRASGTAVLAFDGVAVRDEQLIGELNGGFAIALAVLNTSRIGIAAMCLGVAREALDLAWRYAHERAIGPQPLAAYQVTQHAFADMQIAIQAMEALVYRTAAAADAGDDIVAEASVCKVFASEAAQRVVDHALQLHGGAGYLRDAPIERLYRDIRAARIYEGANEVQRNNIYRVMRHRRA